MSKIVGIDLGSTLSEISVFEGGKPTVIVNEDGSYTTPSVISFKDGERKVGSAAKRQAVLNPKETVVLIKRFMGGTYDEVKDNISHIQYNVVNDNGRPKVEINDKKYTPEELSAMILSKMKKIAEDYLGEEVKDAVITVPAYFSDAARQATKTAGEIAGLNVLRLVAEPTAAILASNIDKKKGGKFLVVDYGGSTLDNSVADISDDVVEILASNGDVYCGGSDLDRILANWIVDEYKSETGTDISKDNMAMSRVYEAAEKAKMELSNQTTTEINLPYITVVDGNPVHLVKNITRATFEKLISGEVDKVIGLAKTSLEKAKISSSDLNGILLVGGSTRIPLVQSELEKAFGAQLIKSANVDLVVAEGAAVQGGILNSDVKDVLLLDVTAVSMGIKANLNEFVKIIEGNTTIPVKKSQIFTTAVDNQPAVDIEVYQGERLQADKNKLIGKFTLDGIPSAKAHTPQIEVSFDMDANGLLTVSAVDKGTGKEQHITIESSMKLDDSEIERMKKEAEQYAEEDKKFKEESDTINGGQAVLFNNEKQLTDLDDKLTDEEKDTIKDLNTRMKDALEKKDLDAIKNLVNENIEKWTPISTRLYSSATPGENTGTTGFNPFGNYGGFNPFGNGGGNPFDNQPK